MVCAEGGIGGGGGGSHCPSASAPPHKRGWAAFLLQKRKAQRGPSVRVSDGGGSGGGGAPREGYEGFVPPKGWSVPRVAYDAVTPEDFYARFVATRTPCLIVGLPSDGTWDASVWSLPALAASAGTRVVSAEVRRPQGRRDGDPQPFGHGNRVAMKFEEVVKEIQAGSERVYLSAQELTPLPEGARVRPPLPVPMHPLPPPMVRADVCLCLYRQCCVLHRAPSRSVKENHRALGEGGWVGDCPVLACD
jgi:hypothetical protein